MKRHQTLLSVLISFIFLVVPAIVGIYFALAFPELPYFYMWVIALSFLVYANVLTYFCYLFKIVSLRAFTFNTPLSLVLASLFIARDFPWWGMLILAVGMVLTAIPANMIVQRIVQKKRAKAKQIARN